MLPNDDGGDAPCYPDNAILAWEHATSRTSLSGNPAHEHFCITARPPLIATRPQAQQMALAESKSSDMETWVSV